jgi:hypothetical protein
MDIRVFIPVQRRRAHLVDYQHAGDQMAFRAVLIFTALSVPGGRICSGYGSRYLVSKSIVLRAIHTLMDCIRQICSLLLTNGRCSILNRHRLQRVI